MNLITYAFNHLKEKCVLQNKQKRFNVINGNANEKKTKSMKKAQDNTGTDKIRSVIMP